MFKKTTSVFAGVTIVYMCVKPARVFLHRILTLHRDNANNDTIFLSKEFFKYLNWFSLFLKQFNVVVFYDVRPISADLCLDACLTGLGGVYGRQCYALPLPKDFNNYTIVHLEMLNVLVALKIWVINGLIARFESNVITAQWSKFLLLARPKTRY